MNNEADLKEIQAEWMESCRRAFTKAPWSSPPFSLFSQTPEAHLAKLKELWAFSVLSEENLDPALVRSLCMHPFSKAHPIGRVLSCLLAKQIREPLVPLVLIHPLLPLYESYQLCILWAIAGEEERARALAEKMAPLYPLLTLWSRENSFQEEEARLSWELFQRITGSEEKKGGGKGNPFFLALEAAMEKKKGSFFPIAPQEHRIEYPELGFSMQKSGAFSGALSLAGDRTALGVFHAKSASIRAYGPQLFSLRLPENFGILREPDSQPLSRWAAVAADPEVWMEVHSAWEADGQRLQLRFFGLKPSISAFFCFYIRASHSQMQELKISPRSLSRYKGESKPVCFGGTLSIESLAPLPMELIPLAGEGGFWNCDYLLAFSLSPLEGRAEFRLQAIS